jgi:hypothetical protein
MRERRKSGTNPRSWVNVILAALEIGQRLRGNFLVPTPGLA